MVLGVPIFKHFRGMFYIHFCGKIARGVALGKSHFLSKKSNALDFEYKKTK